MTALAMSASPSEAAFPGQNGRIAFDSSRFGGRDVFVQGVGETEATRLTDDAGADMDPMWSADGFRLAFWSDRDGNREIYVMGVDGSGQTNLTNDPALDDEPAWSPDGSRIAFTARATEVTASCTS